MTEKKYRRAKNAEAKIAEETDIITILKTLRSARFLIDKYMSVKQQQAVDFFQAYSLETKSIYDKKRMRIHKADLLDML